MKKTLLALAILFAPLVALAADPVVVVNNVSSVTVDGVPAGSVVDVLANINKPNIRARLLDALIAREAAIVAVEKARADTAVAAAVAAKTAAENSQAAAVAARLAAESRVAAIVTAIKSTQIVAPLPSAVAQAILDEDAKKRAALLAQKAAIEADIAKIP